MRAAMCSVERDDDTPYQKDTLAWIHLPSMMRVISVLVGKRIHQMCGRGDTPPSKSVWPVVHGEGSILSGGRIGRYATAMRMYWMDAPCPIVTPGAFGLCQVGQPRAQPVGPRL